MYNLTTDNMECDFEVPFIPNIIGIVGTIIEFIIHIPQIYTTLKVREFKGLSLTTCFINIVNSLLWVVYALYLKQYIMAVGSGFVSLCNTIIFVCYCCTRMGNKESMISQEKLIHRKTKIRTQSTQTSNFDGIVTIIDT